MTVTDAANPAFGGMNPASSAGSSTVGELATTPLRAALPLETVETSEEAGTADQTEEARPWNVLVWNDPINLMNYVTFVFRKVFGYSEAKAHRLMLDVHEKGRALVAQGTRTEAERDVHRLQAHGLWATMEQSD